MFVSPLLNKTRQTGGWAGTVQTSDVRKQLSWEEMLIQQHLTFVFLLSLKLHQMIDIMITISS